MTVLTRGWSCRPTVYSFSLRSSSGEKAAHQTNQFPNLTHRSGKQSATNPTAPTRNGENDILPSNLNGFVNPAVILSRKCEIVRRYFGSPARDKCLAFRMSAVSRTDDEPYVPVAASPCPSAAWRENCSERIRPTLRREKLEEKNSEVELEKRRTKGQAGLLLLPLLTLLQIEKSCPIVPQMPLRSFFGGPSKS